MENQSHPRRMLIDRARVTTIAGAALLVGLLASGYFYNVTFIQLGLMDLCRRILDLPEAQTAFSMAGLALLALLAALAFGGWMARTGRGASFSFKLRVSLAVVAVQTLLTLLVIQVTSLPLYGLWLACAALSLGVGMPAAFALTIDLVPVTHRGWAAGLTTAAAYFASNAFSSADWRLEHFRHLNLLLMIPGMLALAVFVYAKRPAWLIRLRDDLSRQHARPEFAHGRFTAPQGAGRRYPALFPPLLALLFMVFFIDSLGFLRLVDMPLYMRFAWQSVTLDVHLLIAGVHVMAALAGGALYRFLSVRQYFLWIFAFFALAQIQYALHGRFASPAAPPLAMPILYAVAVSLYTVLNFAIWADLSTPRTIALFAAVGIAFSGWAATFLSTGLAVLLKQAGLPFAQHFELVNALSVSGFLALLLPPLFQGLAPGRRSLPREMRCENES